MGYEAATTRVTDPNPSPVTITITLGKQLSVHPDPLILHLGDDQEVLWVYKDARGQQRPFKIIFKGQSPFDRRVFTEANPHSGRPRPDVGPNKRKKYGYTVKTVEGTVDPELIVDY